MSILILGLNHKSAPVEVREKISLSKPRIKANAELIKNMAAIDGMAVLSTCNRTEFYFSSTKHKKAVAEVESWISDYSGIAVAEMEKYLYIFEDVRAVRHLYEVVGGLDSMILGESQIQGQVQDAYNLALECGFSNSIINTLFMNALSVGKRVRTETYIDRQPVSISSAAVDLAKSELGTLEGKTVLILGAGETSELAARHLVSNGISSVIVANRTFERAKIMANEFGGSAAKLSEFLNYIIDADIIISCTSSPRYVVKKEEIAPFVAQKKSPLLFIDIAVPRDIEPAVAELDNVRLYDIDDLQNQVQQNLESRRNEAVKAQKIIDQEVSNFFYWLDTLAVVPTIIRLRSQAERIKKEEVERALNRIENVTEREKRIVEQLAHSIISRLMHKPIVNLKTLAGENEDRFDCYIRAFNDLLALEEEDPAKNEQKSN